MPRHPISDAHEWIREIPTVPIYCLAKPQPRERAWKILRGKKTLLSLTLVCCAGRLERCRISGRATASEIPLLSTSSHLPGEAECVYALLVLSFGDPRRGHTQVGSLAGAARLLKNNAGARF